MDFNLPLGNSTDVGARYYWYCDRDISVLDTHHQEDCPYTHPRRMLLRPTKKKRLPYEHSRSRGTSMHLEDSAVKTAVFGWVAILSRKDLYKNQRDRSPCIILSGFNESHFVRMTVDRGSNIATRHLPCKCKDYTAGFAYKDLLLSALSLSE